MSEAANQNAVLLTCIAGPDNGKRIAVTSNPIFLGRSSACELASDDPDVSDKHLSLELKHGKAAFATVASGPVFLEDENEEDRLRIM